MGGMLDDMEKRLEEGRAKAQQKKLIEAQEKAKQEAERAKKKDDNNWVL